MDLSREGHTGLYTMHLSNLFPETPAKGEAQQTGAAPSPSPSAPGPLCSSLTEFSQWHVLIRMNVETDVCYVKGDAKVFSPTPSLTSTAARGMKRNGEAVVNQTAPDGVPIVPIHQKDRKCNVMIEGVYRNPLDAVSDGDGASNFRLEVHLQRLEGELLGLRAPAELQDVTLNCSGYRACGWNMGPVSVTAAGKPVAMTQTLHFMIKPYYGKRCTFCLDPVYAIGFTCDECETTQYCSRECLNAHMRKGHGLLCPLLKSQYRCKSASIVSEVSIDTGLVAWWRCLNHGWYSILVDNSSTLGCAVEVKLCTMKSAKEGLQYQLITPKPKGGSAMEASTSPPLPTDEDVINFSCVLLREVTRSAILARCVSLAAACLNHLYIFSPSTEITIQTHILFSTAFHCNHIDGPITTVEEYVSYARSLHSLAALLTEYALKSLIPSEFWRRIREARATLVALARISRSDPCPELEGMREVASSQQCEVLTAMAKIFIIMATRAPESETRMWLIEAEKCLRQCMECDYLKRNRRAYAQIAFRLSVVLLLYKEDVKSEEARMLRMEGEEVLRLCRPLRDGSHAEKSRARSS